MDLDKLIGTQIEGRYRITDEIGTGGMGKVYRAIPYDDPSSDVAIKLIQKPTGIELDDLLLFQKEAALLSQLHHPNIIYFHEMGVLNRKKEVSNITPTDGYYIVMEIAQGKNLKSFLGSIDQNKDLSFFFEIGIQVASALDYTHSKNIIHRDIKPQNIIVGKAWKESEGILIKVLDFGVARLLESSGQASSKNKVAPQEDVAGTPLYMSPEQTSWMNHPVDHRADLYSLGCVLYEVATGRPPFSGQTREKIMRCHASVLPEPISSIRPDIPKIIENIILKLLSKDPSERYQTAYSLISDLKKTRSLLSVHPSPKLFLLGANDKFNSVSSKLEIIGRKYEQNRLVKYIEEIVSDSGKNKIVLLKGVPGIGRTKLISEFKRDLISRDINYISARFTRYEEKIPYIGLSTAFNEFLLDMIKMGGSTLDKFSIRLFSYLGTAVSEISDIVPVLDYFRNSKHNILGKNYGSDDITKIDIDIDKDESLLESFSVFVRCLVDDKKTLVFLLDDFEAIDNKSLKLLEKIITSNNSKKLMFVISIKSEFNNLRTEISKFVKKCEKRKQRFEEIELSPFTPVELEEFTKKMLGADYPLESEFINYLHSKTSGNPLNLSEYLRAMVTNNLLTYNQVKKNWQYDISVIRKKHISLESVDLILNRLDFIDSKEMMILEIASVVGMVFRFELLLLSDDIDSIVVVKTLQNAIRENLISRVPDEAKNRHLGKSFSFNHRLIKESIYKRISTDRKSKLHYLILKKLVKSNVECSSDMVFTFVHHVNQAISISNHMEKRQFDYALIYNLAAASYSAKLKIWQIAERYFEIVYFLLKDKHQDPKYTKTYLSVVENLGDTALLLKKYSLAIKLYKTILSKLKKGEGKNRILYKLIKTFAFIGDDKRSVRYLMFTIFANFPEFLNYNKNKNWLYKWSFKIKSYFDDDFTIFYSKYSYSNQKLDRKLEEKKYFILSLTIGMKLFRTNDIYKSLYFLNMVSKYLKKQNEKILSLDESLSIMSYHLYWYGYFNNKIDCYKYYDYSIDLAKTIENKQALSEILIKRAQGIDYYNGRLEDVFKTVISIGDVIEMDEHLEVFSEASNLLLSNYFSQGDFKKIGEISKCCFDFLPPRNKGIPFTMAVFFYSLLIRGVRDSIVSKGNKIRRQYNFTLERYSNPFDLIVQIIIFQAKGEENLAKKLYYKFLDCFSRGISKNRYYPFEIDFLLFFTITFSDIYTFDTREKLIDFRYVPKFTEKILALCNHLNHSRRPIPLLVRAKILEKTPFHSTAKLVYDSALSLAKLQEFHLIKLFIKYYFGSLLNKETRSRNKDFIDSVLQESKNMKFQILVEIAEKEIFLRGKNDRSATPKDEASLIGKPMSVFLMDHLWHVAKFINIQGPLANDYIRSLELLKKYFNFEKASVAIAASNGSMVLFYTSRDDVIEKELVSYLLPFKNLRSSLFISPKDIPWSEPNFPTKNPKIAKASFPIDSNSMENQRENIADIDTPGSDDSTVILNSLKIDLEKPSDNKDSSLLSILIPIRLDSVNLGTIVIEKAEIRLIELDKLREELDTFGNQIALNSAKKHPFLYNLANNAHLEKDNFIFMHNRGSIDLEKVPWLSIWSHKNRTAFSNSHGWYLGLNFGKNDFGLFYCNLMGDSRQCRELSEMLWYQVYVIRSLALVNGENTFTVKDIQAEIQPLFLRYPNLSKLHSISFTFTLFNRSAKTANSGHYGSARPVLLGGEELVTPYNKKIVTFSNGRVFRYYEVDAIFRHLNSIYFLFEKTDILKSMAAVLLEKALLTEKSFLVSPKFLHNELISKFTDQKTPKFYVAASFNLQMSPGNSSKIKNSDGVAS